MRDEYGNERSSVLAGVPRQPNYTTSGDVPWEVAKVLGMAGGVAGALAGIWVLLTEREKEPEPASTLQQARAMIEEAAERARKDGLKAGEPDAVAAKGAEKGKRKDAKAARSSSSGKGKKAQQERNETIEKIAQLLKDARDEASRSPVKGLGEASGLLNVVRSEAAHRLDDAKKARQDAQRPGKDASQLAETLKSKAMDVEQQAAEYVGTAIVPKVLDLTHTAQAVIETGKEKSGQVLLKAEQELLPEAKRRAGELRQKADQDVVAEAKKRAEDIRKRAGEELIPEAKRLVQDVRTKAEAELLPEAKKRAEGLAHTVEGGTRVAKQSVAAGSAEAAAKLSTVTSTVETQAAEAGEAVKRGTREAQSLLLWLALAGALIFTVFLDEEQQKRLKEIASGIFGEAKDMYADMKGEDTSRTV